MIYRTYCSSPLGEMLLEQQDEALTGAWFVGQKYYPREVDARWGTTPLLSRVQEWLDAYFAGQHPDLTSLPLAPIGSPFRQEVWQILTHIPYGETMTYGQIAAILARRRGIPTMSAQAVGGAVGHNSISILIPCHRVLGTGGSLTGYAGGLPRKQALLRLEQDGHL